MGSRGDTTLTFRLVVGRPVVDDLVNLRLGWKTACFGLYARVCKGPHLNIHSLDSPAVLGAGKSDTLILGACDRAITCPEATFKGLVFPIFENIFRRHNYVHGRLSVPCIGAFLGKDLSCMLGAKVNAADEFEWDMRKQRYGLEALSYGRAGLTGFEGQAKKLLQMTQSV